MRFKVLKSGLDALSGGASLYATIDEALKEVFFYRGWPTPEALHEAIRKWATQARPGDVFCTQVSAVVAVSGVGHSTRNDGECPECLAVGLEYGELLAVNPDAPGVDLVQEMECPECGHRWQDVFVLVEQRPLGKND